MNDLCIIFIIVAFVLNFLWAIINYINAQEFKEKKKILYNWLLDVPEFCDTQRDLWEIQIKSIWKSLEL